jgi:hypothetical protein
MPRHDMPLLGQVTGDRVQGRQAQNDLATVYNDGVAEPATATIPTELGGTIQTSP